MRTLALPLLVACAAPDPAELRDRIDLHLEDGGPAANTHFIELIDRAQEEVAIALPGIADPLLTDAILDARARDVYVEVIVDVDHFEDEGVQALLRTHFPVRLADRGLAYFDFGTNQDVSWRSDQTHMTHAFAVADRLDFVLANGAGDLEPGTRTLFSGYSEDLAEDLLLEHNQIFGGTDATTTTAFDALAKSIADVRWRYPTQGEETLEVWFNPQERGVKRIIDAVYRAKQSVRIMSEDFADQGLARALQHKAEDGFDVEVLVGRSFGQASQALSDVLSNQAPDVPLVQSTTPDPLPTLVFIDFDRARDGFFHRPTVHVLTHPIWSSARLFAGVEVHTDQLTDGALYVYQVDGAPSAPLQDLAAVYQERRALSEVLR